jgi:CYTH domain-containing protein
MIIKGEEIVRKRQISAREFIQLMEQIKNDTNSVEKNRHCFIYKNQNFVVDVFKNIKGNPTILRIETDKMNDDISIPPFVTVHREVTGESTYFTSSMGKKDYKMPQKDVDSCLLNDLLLERKSTVSFK